MAISQTQIAITGNAAGEGWPMPAILLAHEITPPDNHGVAQSPVPSSALPDDRDTMRLRTAISRTTNATGAPHAGVNPLARKETSKTSPRPATYTANPTDGVKLARIDSRHTATHDTT